MPNSSGYDTVNKSGDSVERALASRGGTPGESDLGNIRSKPGADYHMSRSGAIDGNNPDAQVTKPRKTHTISKATN